MIDEFSFDQVLTSARNGDGAAFANLYELMNRRVYGFASARGAPDPEGLVNDVFLKVFTGLNGFVGNEIQFSAWVFKIARNTLIDEARRRKRQPDTTELSATDDSPMVLVDVELEAIRGLSNDWLLAQLDLLTAEQRDVVVMRIVSDLTVEAISEVLGKPVGAVKAMQRRAFRTLARNFDHQAVPK